MPNPPTRKPAAGGQPDAAAGRSLVLDFDGTITETDMLDGVARRFGDAAVYQEIEDGLHEGRLTLRECITLEFEPVRAPLEEVVAWVLEHLRIRPGFPELVALARERGWRVIVLSSGFEELIRPILARLGVEVEVVANRVDAGPDGWLVHWRDGAVCPVCGEACKRAALPAEGDVVYVGDGISDRCAALAADLVFATRGLARYLDEQGIPYVPFSDFFEVAARLDP